MNGKAIRASVVLPLVICSNYVFAGDCSKLTAQEIRMLDDPEKTCGKVKRREVKPDINALKKRTMTVGKEAVLESLKDPSSAQFKNVRTSKDGWVLCGELNAKNSYGGYTGFKRFYFLAAGGTRPFYEGGDEFHENLWREWCVAN